MMVSWNERLSGPFESLYIPHTTTLSINGFENVTGIVVYSTLTVGYGANVETTTKTIVGA